MQALKALWHIDTIKGPLTARPWMEPWNESPPAGEWDEGMRRLGRDVEWKGNLFINEVPTDWRTRRGQMLVWTQVPKVHWKWRVMFTCENLKRRWYHPYWSCFQCLSLSGTANLATSLLYLTSIWKSNTPESIHCNDMRMTGDANELMMSSMVMV